MVSDLHPTTNPVELIAHGGQQQPAGRESLPATPLRVAVTRWSSPHELPMNNSSECRWSRYVRCTTRLSGCAPRLDGLSFDGATVLEIKCLLSIRDQNAAQQGRVPSPYYGQLQHQLEVSGAEEAHYWSFDGHRASGPDPTRP